MESEIPPKKANFKFNGKQGYSSTTVESGDRRMPNATEDEKVRIGKCCLIIQVNNLFYHKITYHRKFFQLFVHLGCSIS